jgi:hypothetical protein
LPRPEIASSELRFRDSRAIELIIRDISSISVHSGDSKRDSS